MSDTKIEWATKVWNPVTGCTKVSPGCAHCYIERTPPFRMNGRKFVKGTTGVTMHPERVVQPYGWKSPERIFVNSLSDLFHEEVTDNHLDRIFGTMMALRRHTFMVLTKRPERMRSYVSGLTLGRRIALWGSATVSPQAWPLPNVWLGVSVENQHWADVRIPLLLQTPAAVRFLSCEPLLGPVDLCGVKFTNGAEANALRRDDVSPFPGSAIDWVIVGGESGPDARPMDIAWVRSIRDQCAAAGVALFVKQLGKRPLGLPPLRHVKKGDHANRAIETWPEDLRIREFPRRN